MKNTGLISKPYAWLHINEGPAQQQLSILNDIAIDTYAQNLELDIQTNGGNPPVITNTPNYAYAFKLGMIIRETSLANTRVYGPKEG